MTEKRTAAKVNKWESPDGAKTRYYITFADGSEAVTFDSKVAEAIPIGEETDYEMQPPKQEGWKPSVSWLPSILGAKPQRGGGGPGRAPRDEAFIQERMDRRTALMTAKDLCIGQPLWDAEVLRFADKFYAWLRSPALPKSQAAQDSDQKAGVAVAPFGEDQTRPSTVQNRESKLAVEEGEPGRFGIPQVASKRPDVHSAPLGSEHLGGEPQALHTSAPTATPAQSPPTVDVSGPPPLDTGTGELAAAQGVTEDVAELGTTGEGVSGSAAFNDDPYWALACCDKHNTPLPYSEMARVHPDLVAHALNTGGLTNKQRKLAARWLREVKAGVS